MGCPDAVRAELANLSGLAKVEYLVDRDLFAVEYDPDRVSLETIFTAVWMAGRNTGREFIPELVT